MEDFDSRARMGITSSADAGPQIASNNKKIVIKSKIYWNIFQALFGEAV